MGDGGGVIKKGDARECKIYIFFLSVSTFFHFLFGEGQKAHVGPEEDIKASALILALTDNR